MKQKFTVILFLIITCNLFCAVNYSNGLQCAFPLRGGKLIIWSQNSEPDHLNPILVSNAGSYWTHYGTCKEYTDTIYESMVTWDRNGTFIPWLAKTWTISPDQRTFSFELRNDVYWHDGIRFTSEDVIFTMDRILDPRTNTYSWFVDRFQNLDFQNVPYRALSDYIVQFSCSEIDLEVWETIAFLKIIPKHVFQPLEINGEYHFNDHQAKWHPVGTGPFMFKE